MPNRSVSTGTVPQCVGRHVHFATLPSCLHRDTLTTTIHCKPFWLIVILASPLSAVEMHILSSSYSQLTLTHCSFWHLSHHTVLCQPLPGSTVRACVWQRHIMRSCMDSRNIMCSCGKNLNIWFHRTVATHYHCLKFSCIKYSVGFILTCTYTQKPRIYSWFFWEMKVVILPFM